MTIQEFKQTLLNIGMSIEECEINGQYKVTSSDGTWYNNVKFFDGTNTNIAYVQVEKVDVDGVSRWENYTLEGFIKLMED